MKHVKEIFVLLSLILFISCKSTSKLPVSQFKSNYPLAELTGTYWIGNPYDKENLAYVMLGGWPPDEPIEYVSFKFNGKDSLNVRLLKGLRIIKELNYTGKVKNNFFEIYFKKNPYVLPPVLVNYNYSRVRIGLTQDNQLIAHFWRDKTNGTLIFYHTEKKDQSRIYERISDDKRYLVKYDFDNTTIPDSEHICKVRKDSLWALADTSGQLITDFEYTFIEPYDKYVRGYKVSSPANRRKYTGKNYRMGYINARGEQIIPVVYDYVCDTNIENLKKITAGNSEGFAFPGRIVCPPLLRLTADPAKFEVLDVKGADPNMKYTKVRYKGDDYYLGMDGYLYPYNNNIFTGKVMKIQPQYRFIPE